MNRVVYIVSHPEEKEPVEELSAMLRQAGFEPQHYGTVKVGDSPLEVATRHLSSGTPMIVCGTYRGVSTRWVKQLANAANSQSSNRVFVLQMHEDVDVEHLSLARVVATYWQNRHDAFAQLVEALNACFPEPVVRDPPRPNRPGDYLDVLTGVTQYDAEALVDFRGRLRPQVLDRAPADLTDRAFLERLHVMRAGELTRAGVLLFALDPSALLPTALVRTTTYTGTSKDTLDERRDLFGSVPRLIEDTWSFVADQVSRGEVFTEHSVFAETDYAYPMLAVRELIANALVHRDYGVRTMCVHVRLFRDRLEITSPGAWEGRDLEPGQEHHLADLSGQSRRRNFRLAQVLTSIPIVEGDGGGIPRAVAECDRQGAPRPVVLADDGCVSVVLRPKPRPRRSAQTTAFELASRLRSLREGVSLTQRQLADALSSEARVGAATISSWESRTRSAIPTSSRIEMYARFFASQRSLVPEPHLLPPDQLTPEEQVLRRDLANELLDLRAGALEPNESNARSIWRFEDGASVVIVSPQLPPSETPSQAAENNPNYNRMLAVADLDAVVELYGHLRAENPTAYVALRTAADLKADDLAGHLVLIGGIAWNSVTHRLLGRLPGFPVRQVEDPGTPSGEIFVTGHDVDEIKYQPTWSDDSHTDLVEDVALFARLSNPFNTSRTLTMCNGIHSRGVLGSVRCFTDERMRHINQEYTADRFGDGEFGLLVRVPVLSGSVVTPDLTHLGSRLYEWPSDA